jgi:(1->4)-alpha-D-glucan 1-alpha-D-glucosylmutase
MNISEVITEKMETIKSAISSHRRFPGRLQKDCWLEASALKLKQDPQFSHIDLKTFKPYLIDQVNQDLNGKTGAAFRPVYIVVEKILGKNESLNQDWPVEGTTGYEFTTALSQIFVDQKHRRSILDIYQKFTGLDSPFDDIAYNCKNLVMKTTMAGEVNMLAHRLNTISEKSWEYRDFTLNSLRDAIREVIACFPVYRTFVNANTGAISENDKVVIDSAIENAKRRNPAVSSAIFDFVKDTLLLKYPTGMEESGRDEQRLFVMRFQQFTSPVMAKDVEDTAFYIYNPLISLNEVGGDPRSFGTPIGEFHKQNILRQETCPRSFISTSTHDSKRGEDVRSRINVLSEIPGEWKSALSRWSRLNKSHKIKLNGEHVPDRNEEYLLYQTLIGTYPVNKITATDLAEYRSRIQNYMQKAVKEAKVHTSWINPNASHEKGVTHFVEAILDPSPSNLFLADFKLLNQLVATCGMYNSLSQVILKVFSPGVPDIYQGNELWAFNLTDPDNRNPVDYNFRIQLLRQLQQQISKSQNLKDIVDDLVDRSPDGRIKLYVTWKSLNYRRDHRELIDRAYLPFKVRGSGKGHLIVFAWKMGAKNLIVVAPRLLAALTYNAVIKPLGEKVWGDTNIILPKLSCGRYINIFTGETIRVAHEEDGPELSVAKVFKSLPVAVLESA